MSEKPKSGYMSMSKISQGPSDDDSREGPRRQPVDFQIVPTCADCGGQTNVVLLFNKDVSNVDVFIVNTGSVSDAGLKVAVKCLNDRSFSLTAPCHSEGEVEVVVNVGGRHVGSRKLAYSSPSLRLARGQSLFYVRQVHILCDYVVRLATETGSIGRMAELDRLLANSVGDVDASVIPMHVYEELFGILRHSSATGQGRGSETSRMPTLLHLAATHGLTVFAVRLVDLPDSVLAASMKDDCGRTPGDVARQTGHTDTAAVFDKALSRGSAAATGKQPDKKTRPTTFYPPAYNDVPPSGGQTVNSTSSDDNNNINSDMKRLDVKEKTRADRGGVPPPPPCRAPTRQENCVPYVDSSDKQHLCQQKVSSPTSPTLPPTHAPPPPLDPRQPQRPASTTSSAIPESEAPPLAPRRDLLIRSKKAQSAPAPSDEDVPPPIAPRPEPARRPPTSNKVSGYHKLADKYAKDEVAVGLDRPVPPLPSNRFHRANRTQ